MSTVQRVDLYCLIACSSIRTTAKCPLLGVSVKRGATVVLKELALSATPIFVTMGEITMLVAKNVYCLSNK